jgi:hypothetical protein
MKGEKLSRIILFLEIGLIVLLHINKNMVSSDTARQSLPGITGSATTTTGVVISKVIR